MGIIYIVLGRVIPCLDRVGCNYRTKIFTTIITYKTLISVYFFIWLRCLGRLCCNILIFCHNRQKYCFIRKYFNPSVRLRPCRKRQNSYLSRQGSGQEGDLLILDRLRIFFKRGKRPNFLNLRSGLKVKGSYLKRVIVCLNFLTKI